MSYVVTACNEIDELKVLLPKLIKQYKPSEDDEIVIQLDMKRTQEVYDYCQNVTDTAVNMKLIECDLNGDFAAFKNNFITHCTKQSIFQLDADEVPHPNLLATIKEILVLNPRAEAFALPRINLVTGLTPEHIAKWGWRINEQGYINHPDYQIRVWRNKPTIKWEGKVHERLVGLVAYSRLPYNDYIENKPIEDYSLIHVKSIERQERQNKFYESI